YAPLLRQCSKQRSLHSGRRLHAQILRHRLDRHTLLCNLLVQMYGRCGCLDEARSIFDKTPERNLFSWSIMIAAYAQNGHPTFALAVYREMLQRSIHAIDSTTYVSALSACSALGDLETGKSIHERILSSKLEIDAFLGTALISMYSKCGCLEEAHECFDCVLRKDIVVWNAMIAAFAQNGHPQRALNFFHAIPRGELQPNNLTLVSALDACSDLAALEEGRKIHALIESSPELTLGGSMGNALVNLYGKCGRAIDARAVFDALRPRTVVSWTSMIAAYAQNGHSDQALELFQRMDMAPNGVTLLSVLQACSEHRKGSHAGKTIHAHIRLAGFDGSPLLDSALVNMYGKVGNLDSAMVVFTQMRERDAITWTAMISSYAQHGHSRQALSLFSSMLLDGIATDAVTLACVSSACSHSGDVKLGWDYFVSSVRDFGERPTFEHYVVMSDMLSRAGRLQEAEDLLRSMPFQPDLVSWRTLLSACSNHNNPHVGKRVADRILELSPSDPAALVLLSNIYSAA
ncbi:hypothetical protein SELMODRAFT_11658, partial [Selaginella moellendorffii]